MHAIGCMTPLRGSQDASKTPHDGFGLLFGTPTWSHVGHFFDTRRSQEPQDASEMRSWECLGAFWGRLGASWRPRPKKDEGNLSPGAFWVWFRPHFLFVLGALFKDLFVVFPSYLEIAYSPKNTIFVLPESLSKHSQE